MRFSGAAFIACFASFSLMPNAFAALSKNKSSNLRERRTNHELDHFVVDANPNFTGLLGRCQGDCDDDDDCQVGLMCFQRLEGNIAVPGCDGGEEDDTRSDYCIPIPTTNSLMVEANRNFTIPLGRCRGDCDTDDECELDLVCFQRLVGNIAVPGCDGGLEDSTPSDYCIADPTRAVLAVLYDVANGINWFNDNNWGDTPLIPTCSLTDVTCSDDGKITRLELGKSNAACIRIVCNQQC
jgi:hypothetical protein